MSDLRQQLLMTRDVAYEEVQMRNRQLTDKLEEMEKFIQQKKAKEDKVVYCFISVVILALALMFMYLCLMLL